MINNSSSIALNNVGIKIDSGKTSTIALCIACGQYGTTDARPQPMQCTKCFANTSAVGVANDGALPCAWVVTLPTSM